MQEIKRIETALKLAMEKFPVRLARAKIPLKDIGDFDAAIELRAHGESTVYLVEVKKHFTKAIMGQLRLRAKQTQKPLLLIADYVNPNLAEHLREDGIAFLDLLGNAFFKTEHLYIDIQGNKPKSHATMKVKRGKELFRAAGLRLTYELLVHPRKACVPYRHLAEDAKVATGTIARVFEALRDQGYLIGQGRDRELINAKELLDRWLLAYHDNQRNTLLVGQYQRHDESLDRIPLDKLKAAWGAEAAAERLTNFLRAETITIYIHDHGQNIEKLKLYGQLNPEKGGKLEVLRAFWRYKDPTPNNCVHPVLVYADLMATGDPRNAEAAQLIYERHLAGHFKQD